MRDFVSLLRQGKMIAAIKLYRDKTGVGLAEAKAAVETVAAEQGIPIKGSGVRASSSFAACSAWLRSTSFVGCEEFANDTGRVHGRDEIPIVGWHGIDYDSHTFAADGNLRTVVVFGVAARTFQSIRVSVPGTGADPG